MKFGLQDFKFFACIDYTMIHLPVGEMRDLGPMNFEEALRCYGSKVCVNAYPVGIGVHYRLQKPGTAGGFISRERARELLFAEARREYERVFH